MVHTDSFGIYIAAILIGYIFFIMSCNTFMHLFFTGIRSKIMLTISYLLYCVALTFIYSNFQNYLFNILSNLVFYFVISTCYESKLQTVILSSVYLCSIVTMVQTLISNLAVISNMNLDNRTDQSLVSMMGYVFIYYFVLLVKNRKLLQKASSIPNKNNYLIALFPVSSIIITYVMFSYSGCRNIFLIIFIVYLCGINIFVFTLYEGIVRQFVEALSINAIEQQNKYYREQLKIMMDAQNSLKRFRHDNKTRTLVLKTMIDKGEIEEVKKYIDTIGDTLKIKEEIVNTGNMSIDAVINYNLQKGYTNHIILDIDISIPENLNIDSMDSAILLGNLLDNAMEATEKLEEGRIISLKVNYDRGTLLIKSSNPYKGKVKCINGRYYTTKQDKENHGVGILRIQEIVEKYRGMMEINHENQVFSLNMFLYLE